MRAPILPVYKNLARQGSAVLIHWSMMCVIALILLLQMGTAISQTKPSSSLAAAPPSIQAVPPPPEEGDPYDDALLINTNMPSTIEVNTTRTVTVLMRNTGSTLWSPNQANPYRLGSVNPENNLTWGVGRVELPTGVYPTGNVTFTMNIKAPSVPGTYAFSWQMLREGLHWFGSSGSRSITVTAPAPVPAPTPVYNAQMTSANVPTNMTAGNTYNVGLTFLNTGNVTWNRSDGYRLGTSSPVDNAIFGFARAEMNIASVAPGQSATFNFQVTAPAAAGTYMFDWGMLWEFNRRFGQTSAINIAVAVPAAAPKPTISVLHQPSPVAGSSFTTSWSATNATSLSRVCTASDSGYTVSETVPVSGSRTQVALAAWVGYPSTCKWTANGAGGSSTYTETLATAPAAAGKPAINVSRNPAPAAGQAFTTNWSTTNATALSRVCTSGGTGYKVNESLAVNGSRTETALASWVSYPSSCTWTASGTGGTTTYAETVTTAPATTGVIYIHTDGLGSPVARTDASRQVISRTRYEAYGYVAAGAPPTIGFTGHVNDADTGLTYMQQRYYDPVAGRFLSIDPVSADPKTGSSFNRYSYANNNPYSYVDMDGRDAIWVQKKDGTSNLVIKVFGTGVGATATAMAELKARVDGLTTPTGTSVRMEISSAAGPGINTLNMSPGLNTTLCGAPGECVNKLGGNLGHVDSSQIGNAHAGAHEVLHFSGVVDRYVEGPLNAAGERTSVPSPGYDLSNIMTSRAGTIIKAEQLIEAKNNPTTTIEIEK
jgi:RHS repeat-associated protein